LEIVLKTFANSHDAGFFAYTTRQLGELAMAAGDDASAEEHLRRAMNLQRDHEKAPLFELGLLLPLSALHARAGRPEAAEAHLVRVHEILAEQQDWRGLLGDVFLAEGLVRAAQGRLAEAESAFARAVEVYRQFSLPWDEAKVYYEWACALPPSEHARAREFLAKALTLWEPMGAAPYAERCRQRLAALGGGVPTTQPATAAPAASPPATYPAGLTEREVEVLRLVARGLTSAQVAGALVISPVTVSTHLRNIYSKIGVSSRAAATRWFVDHGLA
jgi:DNA-binding CsgD family transcriptional regulator